jgi:hypothetical protein
MKTSDRKIAKQHIAHLRRREDYLQSKVTAASENACGWERGELAALRWAIDCLRPLAQAGALLHNVELSGPQRPAQEYANGTE